MSWTWLEKEEFATPISEETIERMRGKTPPKKQGDLTEELGALNHNLIVLENYSKMFKRGDPIRDDHLDRVCFQIIEIRRKYDSIK